MDMMKIKYLFFKSSTHMKIIILFAGHMHLANLKVIFFHSPKNGILSLKE
jgi:hypothetical protein